MNSTQTAGTYFLSRDQAAAVAGLTAEPETASAMGLPHRCSSEDARAFIERHLQTQSEGTGYAYSIQDRGKFVGLCRLLGLGRGEARQLDVFVASDCRRKGYAKFAVDNLLAFAFRNLLLQRVHTSAAADNLAAVQVIEKNGFHRSTTDASGVIRYGITPAQWKEFKFAPALARLHPALKALLEAELAAGNSVKETGGGWPDHDSVFVALTHPFRARPATPPAGVTYTEPNDPHWWKADYSTQSPTHILAC